MPRTTCPGCIREAIQQHRDELADRLGMTAGQVFIKVYDSEVQEEGITLGPHHTHNCHTSVGGAVTPAPVTTEEPLQAAPNAVAELPSEPQPIPFVKKNRTLNLWVLTLGKGLGNFISLAHLIKGLERLDIDAYVHRVGRITKKPMEFHKGIVAQSLTWEDARKVYDRAQHNVIYIATPPQDNYVTEFLERGAHIVVHSSNEVRSRVRNLWPACRHPIIATRPAMAAYVKEQGFDSLYLPYAYQPINVKRKEEYHAVSFTRIAAAKRTQIVVEANSLLPDEKKIHIFGERNRQFEHFHLNQTNPDWDRYYVGPLPNEQDLYAGARLSARSKHVVDMSEMSGEGGGTQYVFMEAWNAQSNLVLNKKWLTGVEEHDEVANAAKFASDGEELAELIQEDSDWEEQHEAGLEIISNHMPKKVVKRLFEIIQ